MVMKRIQSESEKVATSSNFSEEPDEPEAASFDDQEIDGQVTFTEVIAQEENSAANSNLTIELDAREAALLSMTLTGYLSDC